MKKVSVKNGRTNFNVLIMLLLRVITSASCNGQQKQARAWSTDVTADNPKVKKAKKDIVGRIKELYAVIAQEKEESTERFACHTKQTIDIWNCNRK